MRRSLGLAAAFIAISVAPRTPLAAPPALLNAPLAARELPGDQYTPAIAFDGSTFLVAWSGVNRPSSGIFAKRVSRYGTPLDHPAITVAEGALSAPSLAFGGASYLAVWNEASCDPTQRMEAARITRSGRVIDSPPIVLTSAAGLTPLPPGVCALGLRDPSVATDGDGYLVTFGQRTPEQDAYGNFTYDVMGLRVSAAGAILGSGPFLISPAAGGHNPMFVSAAFDGAHYLVTWVDGSPGGGSLVGARVGPSGDLLDAAPLLISSAPGGKGYPAAACDGGSCLVVWDDSRANPALGLFTQTYGARVGRDGTVLDPDGLPISPVGFQGTPAIAFDGTHYLVTWTVMNGGEFTFPVTRSDSFFTRVAPSGVVLDPAGAPLTDRSTRTIAWTKVAADRSGALAVWSDDRWVAGERTGGFELILTEGRIRDGQLAPLLVSEAPVAIAGSPQTLSLGHSAYLSGHAVDPLQYPISSWRWSVLLAPWRSWSLSSRDAAATWFTPTIPGWYLVSLVASDGHAVSLPSLVWIHAKADGPYRQ